MLLATKMTGNPILETNSQISWDLFFRKNVSFQDILKANFMWKNQKNLMLGSLRTFITDRQIDWLTEWLNGFKRILGESQSFMKIVRVIWPYFCSFWNILQVLDNRLSYFQSSVKSKFWSSLVKIRQLTNQLIMKLHTGRPCCPQTEKITISFHLLWYTDRQQ